MQMFQIAIQKQRMLPALALVCIIFNGCKVAGKSPQKNGTESQNESAASQSLEQLLAKGLTSEKAFEFWASEQILKLGKEKGFGKQLGKIVPGSQAFWNRIGNKSAMKEDLNYKIAVMNLSTTFGLFSETRAGYKPTWEDFEIQAIDSFNLLDLMSAPNANTLYARQMFARDNMGSIRGHDFLKEFTQKFPSQDKIKVLYEDVTPAGGNTNSIKSRTGNLSEFLDFLNKPKADPRSYTVVRDIRCDIDLLPEHLQFAAEFAAKRANSRGAEIPLSLDISKPFRPRD